METLKWMIDCIQEVTDLPISIDSPSPDVLAQAYKSVSYTHLDVYKRQAPDVLANIVAKKGGGIMPLGGNKEVNGSHKGYGYGMLCEIFTARRGQKHPAHGHPALCHVPFPYFLDPVDCAFI